MATGGSSMRRGLPRVAGGEPWPPAASAPAEAVVDASAPAAAVVEAAAGRPAEPSTGSGEPPALATASAPERSGTTVVRRGLPRVAGGEPWPSAVVVAAAGPGPTPAEVASAPPAPPLAAAPSAPPFAAADGDTSVRRGLPRIAGGDAWPPAGTAAAVSYPIAAVSSPAAADAAADGAGAAAEEAAAAADLPLIGTATEGPRAPLSVPQTAWAGRAASRRPQPKPEPQRIGPFTKTQWAGAVVVGGIGLLFAAGMAVLAVRFLLSLDGMRDFLATYPGEYHLPAGAPVGIPAWLGWQHFFNVFLMVLIIRSGLTIRREKRPSVFWAPKNNPKGKTSLTIWFHQALDILWLINGAVFIVLLFVTGQWMRIVPTSWEVVPNALSAALQYVSLDWPTENGWVNYNALQQLAYFSTVFIAAPLAAITGFRMSGMWPKKNLKLSAAYPIEWARRVHFPVMLFFVVFIVIHVVLVLATGALRNLNHMYAAQGSVDPTAYADNWTGFWLFVVSLVVIAAAWVVARPLVLAPIARLFGTVSGR
ncbi:cytochrome b/b6 domain-containing protein [Microbacterium sp. B24]|uniref:cytochrome b/b6 domain-containing protein n=1 Tax=Microbacterium sp. B24 TaxID=95616 RepID=UPI00040781C9|nr:cytochrome b/b6 domain-containing protein [Microbacterium sp. B24]